MAVIHRREALKLLAAAPALGAFGSLPAWAEGQKLILLGHRVHQTVCSAGPGGDPTEEWRKRTGNSLDWVTLDIGPIHERLLREASLNSTGISMAFLLNTYAVPSVINLFEPMDAYAAKAPLEDPSDFSPSLSAAMKMDGKTYGVPFRHSINTLHYNAALFAERGLSGPPRTMEELADHARKLTYTRSDGTKVFGFVTNGDNYANVVSFARAWGGDFITADRKLVANQPPMVKAITLLAQLYKEGVLPPNYATIKNEEITTWVQTGRAAMTLNPFGRSPSYNDKDKSKFPGQVKVSTMPMSAEAAGKPMEHTVEFWSFVIPRNSKAKDAAWDLIRELTSKENTLKTALNGNGSARISTYKDPRFAGTLAYADMEAEGVRTARPPLPAFDNAVKVSDMFVEESQAAILGMKAPQKAMDDLVRRAEPLTKA